MQKVFMFLRVMTSVCLLLVMIATIGTLWGIQKSLERADCYKRAVSDCERPGRVEQFIRDVL